MTNQYYNNDTEPMAIYICLKASSQFSSYEVHEKKLAWDLGMRLWLSSQAGGWE